MDCTVCGEPFTAAEWDDRHELHEPGCKRQMCDCDLPCHARCCPTCAPPPRRRTKKAPAEKTA